MTDRAHRLELADELDYWRGVIVKHLSPRGRTFSETATEAAAALRSSALPERDPLDGLAERLDRVLLTSDTGRFVLSLESAKNIVGIVREWLRSRSSALPETGEAVAWRVRLNNGEYQLTSQPDIATMWAGSGANIEPLYARPSPDGAVREALDYVLPCEVHLDPATTIQAGCRLSTLMAALNVRESDAWKALSRPPQADGRENADG